MLAFQKMSIILNDTLMCSQTLKIETMCSCFRKSQWKKNKCNAVNSKFGDLKRSVYVLQNVNYFKYNFDFNKFNELQLFSWLFHT
jgi:hypothetical protein